jgi:ACS family glucarate transporter-like MFS transporter
VTPALTQTGTLKASRRTNVRWWMLAGLTSFSFVSYLDRANISIAAELMIPALGITKVQMGQIFSSFLIGYAIFQVPGGLLGDRVGARVTLAASALLWALATIITGLLPVFFAGALTMTFVALWMVRFLLGISEATTFPVGNRVVRNWMPPQERAFGTSLFMVGTCTASAFTSPLVSWLMLRFGWQMSFYLTSIPAFIIAVAWYRYSRDTPEMHASVNSAELGYIEDGVGGASSAEETIPLLTLLRQRNVYLLIFSYMSEGYVLFIFVFWLYIYLVEERHFTMMRGGWVATIPWLAALVLAPVGGKACDRLGTKYGRLAGAKIVVMIGYALSGLLLFLAAYAGKPWVSVAALSLSIAFLMGAESPFWATATHLGGAHVGTLSGIMNAAGVLGGIVSTSLVPVLVEHFGWLVALGSGTVMGLFCVVVWTFIKEPDQLFEAMQ